MAKDLDEHIEIIEEENCLTLCDEEGNNKGYVQFYYNTDGFETKFTFIESIISHEPGRGHARRLFERLEVLVIKEGSEYFLLEVDYDNDRAIGIYEHLGFYSLGDRVSLSENIDRIFMRKDLSLDGE